MNFWDNLGHFIVGGCIVFFLATLHEISMHLGVIAKYYANEKFVSLKGPIEFKLADKKEEKP